MPDPSSGLMRRRVRVAACVLCVLVLALILFGSVFAERRLTAPGPLPAGTNFYVPPGNIPGILQTMRAGNVVDSSWATRVIFRLDVRATHRHGALRSGEFYFPAHVSLRKVIDILRYARPVQHHLTIPEGLTAFEIRAIIAKAPCLTGDVPPLAEGAVLPQTIDYTYGESRAQVVARLNALLEHALNDVWRSRRADTPLESRRDLLVLASIVERETGRDDERGAVARVFLNRLSRGIKLQSDPTAIYDASGGVGHLAHPLTRSELDIDRGHNTYVRVGLPVGPICAPGIASLKAVAKAPRGDALYFVATGEDGRHEFSDTLQAHVKAVHRYRQLLRDSQRASQPHDAAIQKDVRP